MKRILSLGTALILVTPARPCDAQEIARTRITPSVATQANERTTSQQCRSYAECALRVEPSFLYGPRVVRGIEGVPVARLEKLSSAEMMQLFAGSDSASWYGHRFMRTERVSRALTFCGIILAGAGLGRPDQINALSVGGAALLVVSTPFGNASARYLSRAVWWYNLGLATPAGR